MVGSLPTAIAAPDDSFLAGQVEVADGVALADDVVLDAAPGCRLVLAPGVCLGSGVIIQAIRGDLVVEPGAVLGSGVLVVGTGRIGQNACIGAESTLVNPAIQTGQVVAPRSLLGDPSRSQVARPDSTCASDFAPTGEPPPQPLTAVRDEVIAPPSGPLNGQGPSPSEAEAEATAEAVTEPPTADSPTLPTASEIASQPATGAVQPPAHGQKQVQQLIATLFPHRQPLNGVSPNGVSPEDKP